MSGGGVIRGPAGSNDCRVYVGNIQETHIETVGSDAEDAVYGRDGYDYDGYRLHVEFPQSGRGSGRGGGSGALGNARGRYGPPSRRVIFLRHLLLSGLPPSGSWQDLKDHMRETGDVCYVDVYQDGTGVVEFVRKEDMTYAVRKLDNTKFRSHEGETAYIRVKTDGPRSSSFGHSRSRSHSRSRGNFFTLNVRLKKAAYQLFLVKLKI
uniref:Serine and arginine rich splicing factor 1b n=1 Tax=Anabas testudineus TaxID=64144 RepID=A0A3Q1JE01_ANATE